MSYIIADILTIWLFYAIFYTYRGGNIMKKRFNFKGQMLEASWKEHLDWIEEFMDKYYKDSENYLFDREDFVQEAMLLLYQKQSIENFTKAEFWSELLIKYDEMKKEQKFSQLVSCQNNCYTMDLKKLELPLLVQKALRVLPKDKRVLVEKYYGLQNTPALSLSQLASITNLPVSTVSSRLYTSLNMLYKETTLRSYRQMSVEEVYTPYQRFIYAFAVANVHWNVDPRYELDCFFYRREVRNYVAKVFYELAKIIYQKPEYKIFCLSFKNDWDYIQGTYPLSRKKVYF